MEDPGLREATASEPPSLEEEFAMQRDWASDEKKCTFIVLDRLAGAAGRGGSRGAGGDASPRGRARALCASGDVRGREPLLQRPRQRRDVRDRGHGRANAESAQGDRARGASRDDGVRGGGARARTFRAKIGFANEASRSLFARLGFEEVSRSEVFREATPRARAGRKRAGRGRAQGSLGEAGQGGVRSRDPGGRETRGRGRDGGRYAVPRRVLVLG